MDWRTTMHANGFLKNFQECWHMCYSWKNVRNPFACMVVLQSTRKGPNHYWNGELLFSSVGPLTLIFVHWLGLSSNMHHILAQHPFGFVCADFSKSTSKYLLFTKVVRKHGFKCFTAMYNLWHAMFFFFNYCSELFNHLNLSKLILQMYFWINLKKKWPKLI